ncbi:MAG TPA: Gfo/Idh/MocA family oxidoreductase [Tepidisphaeraceae bacterium]|nr:Gfo/Idh/MocA family oxidoreductase [Tepidisphaeraceae bacterium]
MGKRVAFLDYQLENYHANVFLKLYRNQLKDRGATVTGALSLDHASGREWATKNEVAYFESAEQLNEQADAYMILAPSNPELHLELAERIIPFGKPVYIDKTFAPDLATAERIFALADRHGVALQTTSALRYTAVQAYVRDAKTAPVKHMITWGGGRSFGEYAIHPLELLISCMGPDATRMMRRGTGDLSQLLVNFTGERTGIANVYTHTDTPYVASVTTEKETKLVPVVLETIFLDNAAAVLDLFESGTPNVDRRETLIIRRIMDAAEDPAALEQFVTL